jgi:hypothetical protein
MSQTKKATIEQNTLYWGVVFIILMVLEIVL